MKCYPQKIKSLLLFLSVFSIGSFATADQVTWSQVSLSQEDKRGSNALLALVRNIGPFSEWLKGEALDSSTQIMVRVSKKIPEPRVKKEVELVTDLATGQKIKAVVTTTTVLSSLRYVITERQAKNPNSYKRVLLVGEEIQTTTKTREEDTEEGAKRVVVISSSTKYNYPALNISEENLDSASSKMYKEAAAKLYSEEAPECVDVAGEKKLCRISAAATKLIRAASRKASDLAKVVAKAKAEKSLEIDSDAPKSVTFEESSEGAIRNVVLAGFVRAKNEKLEAPDAASAWVVKINAAGDVSVEERKAAEDEKVDINSKDVSFE